MMERKILEFQATQDAQVVRFDSEKYKDLNQKYADLNQMAQVFLQKHFLQVAIYKLNLGNLQYKERL